MRVYCFAMSSALAFLAGCIPFPHTSERFPAMQGHVVDAVTGRPLSDAIVAIHDHPGTTAKTDANGSFYFSRRRNYHLGVAIGICGTSWPAGPEWSEWLDVTHPNYEPRQVDASNQVITSVAPYDYDKPYALQDISLMPSVR